MLVLSNASSYVTVDIQADVGILLRGLFQNQLPIGW